MSHWLIDFNSWFVIFTVVLSKIYKINRNSIVLDGNSEHSMTLLYSLSIILNAHHLNVKLFVVTVSEEIRPFFVSFE